MAMLAQRLRGVAHLARAGGPPTQPQQSLPRQAREQHLRVIADATSRALGDANADVRHAARIAATALLIGGDEELPVSVLGGDSAKIRAATLPGIDAASFDASDLAYAPCGRHSAARAFAGTPDSPNKRCGRRTSTLPSS